MFVNVSGHHLENFCGFRVQIPVLNLSADFLVFFRGFSLERIQIIAPESASVSRVRKLVSRIRKCMRFRNLKMEAAILVVIELNQLFYMMN